MLLLGRARQARRGQVSVPQQNWAPPCATSPGEGNRRRSVRGRRRGRSRQGPGRGSRSWQHRLDRPGSVAASRAGLRLPGRGRQAAPGEGCPTGLRGQKPTGAPPYLAGTPERWVMASLSPEGSISRPRSASLGPAWGANRDTVGTY